MNLNHIFSLIIFAIGALHHSEVAVGSIYGRGMPT